MVLFLKTDPGYMQKHIRTSRILLLFPCMVLSVSYCLVLCEFVDCIDIQGGRLGSCDRASCTKYEEKNQQDATIRCLLLTSVSTCFGHHYAHLQENKGPVTAFRVYWSGFVGCGL